MVASGAEIYSRKLTFQEALRRIRGYYWPYHTALKDLIERTRQRYGFCLLVDCHSMPSNPLNESAAIRPDFVLGDRFSTSCNPEFTRFVARQLRAMGYRVSLNKPYAGGYITEHYGRPSAGLHALQIEVNRSLYMDEVSYARSDGFQSLRADIARLSQAMFDMAPSLFDVPRAAAE